MRAMRAFPTALFMVFLAFAGQAAAGPWQDGSGWYSLEEPTNLAGQTLEAADSKGQTAQPGQSLLVVADLAEDNFSTSLEVPRGRWIRLLLHPGKSGELKLYVLYPTGTVDLVAQGQVLAGENYRTWYQTEETGDYRLWFTVDSVESSAVDLAVQEHDLREGFSGPGMGRSGAASPVLYSVAPAAAAPSIGLSTGGAKDINNFRENIEQGYLPLPTDITYEGLFYDYYFQTGQQKECRKLFCPSYSMAVSRDPFSGEPEHYLSVGLNSGLADFSRKKLNLVVVLDYSGSMSSPFSEYYYDRFGNMVSLKRPDEAAERSKMQIADQAVVDLTGHLTDQDRFGMVVFSDGAYTLDPLTSIGDKDRERLKERILRIEATDGTNMEAGMRKGTTLLEKYRQASASEYENRIIFLTDAMPNIGETGDSELLQMLKDNAEEGIYTTFIGIGVDFNTELVENITRIKGASYYSVNSATEFQKRMDEEFDYMVTPLVFDLRLDLEAPGYRIEKVYGSPEADEATGEIMKVNTLFPSRAEEGEVKGGMVLIKLRQISEQEKIRLKVSYQDRNGTADFDWAELVMEDVAPDYYQNDGIRKAVLLSRYADLLKDWTLDQRKAAALNGNVVPRVTFDGGIAIPIELGTWERQSLPLQVAKPYQKLFAVFGSYFQKEREAVGDDSLIQEQAILEKLFDFQSA